jgi:hypothetical protein
MHAVSYARLAGVIFAVIALLQPARAAMGWSVSFEGTVIPVWANWIACLVAAEWSDMDALANARSQMIATLDSFRDMLEELGGGLGVTDPVAGPVVLALK